MVVVNGLMVECWVDEMTFVCMINKVRRGDSDWLVCKSFFKIPVSRMALAAGLSRTDLKHDSAVLKLLLTV